LFCLACTIADGSITTHLILGRGDLRAYSRKLHLRFRAWVDAQPSYARIDERGSEPVQRENPDRLAKDVEHEGRRLVRPTRKNRPTHSVSVSRPHFRSLLERGYPQKCSRVMLGALLERTPALYFAGLLQPPGEPSLAVAILYRSSLYRRPAAS